MTHFNPRSREGSDPIEQVSKMLGHISIHAPAKGATKNWFAERDAHHISIHAPAKGATYSHFHTGCSHPNFNPRSREGDHSALSSCLVVSDFNPRSREGSDHSALSSCLVVSDFNPRSREGSDLKLK